jgi:hypothetical protein
MVEIPQITDPTLEAMKLAIETSYKNEPRNYLGASLIGDPCSRKIWYQYNGYEQSKSSFIGIVAAECGHAAEKVTAERLRMVKGIELHTHKPDGKQYGWIAYGGKMAGHYDGLICGLIQAPKAIHIWEHKDKNHKKFADFQSKKNMFGEKRALKNWSEIYYGQAQMNMHYARLGGKQIDRHYMTVSYAGARDYDSCRTEYDPAYAETLVNKAYAIIENPSPPKRISEQKDFYLCRFCNFKDICHGQ